MIFLVNFRNCRGEFYNVKLPALFLHSTKRSFNPHSTSGWFNLEDESSVTSSRKCRTLFAFPRTWSTRWYTQGTYFTLSLRGTRATLEFQGATRVRTFSVSISIDFVTRKCVLLSLLSFSRLPAVLSLSVERDSKSGVNLRRIQPISDMTPRANRSRVRTLGTRRIHQR